MANSNTATDWSKFDFSNEGIDAFAESKSENGQTDWTKFDFSDEGISAFESLIPEPEPGFIDKTLDIVKEVGLETVKAAPRVLGTVAAQIALLPGAGLTAAIDLIPTMSSDPDDVVTSDFSEFLDPSTGVDPIASRPAFKSGSLSKAEETFKEIVSFPSQLITTEEQAKAVENIGYVAKPFEWSGQAAGWVGKQLNEGLKSLGFADTYTEALFATYGEFTVVLLAPGLIKRLAKTPVKQRGLKVQDLLDEVKANPNMTEGEILRRAGAGSEMWEAKRAELRKTEPVRPRPTIKTEPPKGSVPKAEPAKVRPVDKIPDYEFTSKKGNHYTKVGDSWYNSEGKLIINKFVIKAAEKGRNRFIDIKEAVKPIVKEPEPIEIKVEGEEKVPGLKKEARTDVVDLRTELADKYDLDPHNQLVLGTEYRPDDTTAIVLQNLLVPKAKRRAGVGTSIIKDIQDYAKQTGQDIITTPLEGYTRKFFKGLGFEKVESGNYVWKPKARKKIEPSEKLDLYRDMMETTPLTKAEAKAKGLSTIEEKQPKKPTKKLTKNSVTKFYESQDLSHEDALELANFDLDSGLPEMYERETGNKVTIDNYGEMLEFWRGYTKKQAIESIEADIAAETRESSILQSPLRELDSEVTKKNLQTLPDYKHIDTPEALVQRLTAEVNEGMDDLKVDTSSAKQLIDQLSTALEEWAAGEGLPGGIFEYMSMAELGQASEVFRQLNEFAGKVDRIKIEPSVELYSFGGAVAEGVRQLFNKLTFRKMQPQPVPSKPFVKGLARESVRERRSLLDLATYDTNKFLNSLERKTSPVQREALTFMLEKTGVPDVPGVFSRPDIAKVLKKDEKYLKPIAAEIKEYLDLSWQEIKRHLPDLTVRQIENYITHLWDIPKHKRAEAAAWFSTHARFLEPRFIDTYMEGIERGYKPKTLDVAEIIKVRDSVVNRAISNAQYVKSILRLKANGIHLIQRSTESPLDYVEVDYPMLTRMIPLPKGKAKRRGEFVKESRVRVHPDLVRPLKVIFEERFDHPIISAYEAINGVMKKSILSLSLFHHGALGETGLVLIGPVGTAKIYFDPTKIYKSLVRSEFEIFNKIEVARDSIVHGTQYGATADYPVANIQRWLNDLAEKTKDLSIGNRITKFAKDFNSTWDKALWDYLHDTLKLYAYEALVAKMNPKLGPNGTTMAKREIAQFVNDTFGGQQWENLMITPKEVQMMTWSLLSADWTFSTTRQALSVTGIGKVHRETAGLRKKLGWTFWGRAGLYFGIGMNTLNVLFREWDMKDNPQYYEEDEEGGKEWSWFDKTMFGNTPGKKTNLFVGRYEDGSERYLRWGKQLWDFFELMINPLKKVGGKASPLPQLVSAILTGHTLSGFKNDDIYKKKGLEKALGMLKTVAKAFIPLSIRKVMQDNVEWKASDLVMRSTKGMTRYAVIDYFKQAIVDGDKRMFEETYRAALRNNLPAFTLFNSALGWISAEESAELKKTTEGIEDVKAKMSVSESPREKMRYGKILSRLEREKADIEQGTKLLKSALKKADDYNMIEGRPSFPRLPVISGRSGSPEL